jgi:hypothetical protein
LAERKLWQIRRIAMLLISLSRPPMMMTMSSLRFLRRDVVISSETVPVGNVGSKMALSKPTLCVVSSGLTYAKKGRQALRFCRLAFFMQ